MAGVVQTEPFFRARAALKAFTAAFPLALAFLFRLKVPNAPAVQLTIPRLDVLKQKNVQRLLDANAAGSPIVGGPDEAGQFALEPISADQVRQVQDTGIPILAITRLGAGHYSVRIQDPFRKMGSDDAKASARLVAALKRIGVAELARYGTVPGFLDRSSSTVAAAKGRRDVAEAYHALVWAMGSSTPSLDSATTVATDLELETPEPPDDVDQINPASPSNGLS